MNHLSATTWDSDANGKARERAQISIEAETAEIEARRKLGVPYESNHTWPDQQFWAPDPARAISSHWSKSAIWPDIINGDKDSEAAADSKMRRAGLTNTRVRLLKLVNIRNANGQSLERGSVLDLSPSIYASIVGGKSFEPVPANTPLKEIIRIHMPSIFADARDQAAIGLKREPDTLTVSDVWKFWAKRKPLSASVDYISEIPT